MKKHIGILTFQSSNNYGALLQCYALSTTIKSLGFKVSIIDLKKEYIKDFESLDTLTKQKRLLKKNMNNYFFQREFDVFREKYLKDKFTKSIKKNEELSQFANEFDGVVVGSDQVWRYAYTKSTLENFFLKFASDKTNKVSYAASFGLDYFEGDKALEEKIKILINRFNAVSVREDAGVKICKQNFNIEATQVLDPVFLLTSDNYNDLIEENEERNKNKYLAYYLLNPDTFRDDLLVKTMKSKGLTSKVNIYTNEKFMFKKPSFPLSKYKFRSFSSWLSCIKNCEFMVTDSFHGLAFSIIFNKQFICISNKKRGASRMESILSLLGLRSRLVYEGQENFNVEDLKNIDYNVVNIKLSDSKKESLNFLASALKNK